MKLEPKPGFNPAQLNWGGPDEVVSDACSYCDAAIPEDAVPLRMWREDGWAVVFAIASPASWRKTVDWPLVRVKARVGS